MDDRFKIILRDDYVNVKSYKVDISRKRAKYDIVLEIMAFGYLSSYTSC